jgi:C4-dicarboxylate transporter DctM subunit
MEFLTGISAVMLSALIILILLNCPISASLGLAAALTLVRADNFPRHGMNLVLAPRKMVVSADSLPLTAIPFFMIAGALMEYGGISKRLVAAARIMVGALSEGPAIVAVMASMFFAAVSGSSPATVAAIGSLMIPAMVKQGRDISFASACRASAGHIGVIMPPSIPMITFGLVAGSSIGTLFIAGFIPGLPAGFGLMVAAVVTAKKRGRAGANPATFREFLKALKEGVRAVLMPDMILGGIYSGFFTPTEAANAAVIHGFVVSFFVCKELEISRIPKILRAAAISSAMVMLLAAAAAAFGVLMTRGKIPAAMASFFVRLRPAARWSSWSWRASCR